jgi:hypothetical protein
MTDCPSLCYNFREVRMRKGFLVLLLIPSVLFGAESGSLKLSDGQSAAVASVQQPGRTVLNINITKLDFEKTDSGDQLKIALPEEFGLRRGSYLGPQSVVLPAITRLVAIPFDSDPSFHIIKSDFVVLDNIDLAPADSEELDALFALNGFPDPDNQPDLVTGEVAGIMRDLRLYALTIYPVQYDPEKRQIRVCRALEIELSHPGSQITRYPDHISEAFAPIYRSILDNPQVFDPIHSTRGAYWIIYPDAFQANIQPLVDWKKAKGFDVVTISKNQLGTNSYLAIRDTIRNRFNSVRPQPDYIVIVGDVVMPGGNGIATREYANPFGDGDIESDNYYTFLEGNDYFPEILIGRISIDYVSELSAYLNKLFQYERTPYMGNTNWYLKGTVVAGSEEGWLESSRLTKLWCRDEMLTHGYTQVDTFFADFYHQVYPSEISASINSGVSFVNYRGWAYVYQWSPPYYGSTEIMQLSNGPMYPIMTSIVCGTGDFNDAFYDVCMGETWIRAADRGGAGFIGNSNHDAHTKWTNAIDCGIYWGLFDQGVTTLTQAELMGKMTLYDAFPNNRALGDTIELYFNSYNTLGDPEINCWTAIPRAMNAAFPDSIPLGVNRVDVHVQDSTGVPLDGAVVCLWKDNEIFSVGYTATDGNYHFQEAPSTTGWMRITVTKKGYIPIEDSISYYLSPVSVGYESYSVYDDSSGGFLGDGDGTLNPSERVGLSVLLTNYGSSDTAGGVTARLSSDLPEIAISRDLANYGPIAPGATASPDLPFSMTIGSDIANGADVPFSLDVSDNADHHWQGLIRIPVLAPQIAFDSVSIVLDNGNGRIDPGEIFGIVFHARNIGPKGLFNPRAMLRSSDSHIHFIDSVATLGTIVSQGTGNNQDQPFIASIDQDVYVGRHLNFNVIFSGIGPQVAATSFAQTVGTVTSDDPIGPDNYGYYCFDNTDTTYAYHPIYDWIDISTSWRYVSLSDDDVETIPLPFPVTYYGQTYDSTTICDNGYVALGRLNFATFFNAPIPAPQNAPAMIAPFWDDFVQATLRVYYYHDTTNAWFVIGWRNAVDGDNYRTQTFEIIFLDEAAWPTLTGDNDIIFQYNLVQSATNMSAGISSPDRADGIGYVFNNNYDPGAATLMNGRAIKFTTGPLYLTAADEPPRPSTFTLAQNYPNPFNATTAIKFDLPAAGHVTLDIFNVLGQKIETLVDGDFEAGSHSAVWNAGKNASGLYFYRLISEKNVLTRRMTLIK